jgi:hypothetical protein
MFLVNLGDLTQAVSPPANLIGTTRSPTPDIPAVAVIEAWPQTPRTIAQAECGRYGKPDEITGNYIVWHDKGPWKRVVVWRQSPASVRGAHRSDVLQEVIDYPVPQDRLKELSRFDKRLVVDTISGELSSRSESESLNYLALNLTDEIITNRRSVDNALSFYHNTVRLSRSGKASPYFDRFLFKVKNDMVAGQDSPVTLGD